MYYTYLHKDKQTGEVVYVGKGSNFRYCDYNSRCEEHKAQMKSNELEYVILEYFEDEKEAYINEEKVTDEYKKVGQCKFNEAIGRRTSERTKAKLSRILKGQKRSDETKMRMKMNHSRCHSKAVLMYKNGEFIRRFSNTREAGSFVSNNGICSHGWMGNSLKTGQETKSTKNFPIGGYLFVYDGDKIQYKKDQ